MNNDIESIAIRNLDDMMTIPLFLKVVMKAPKRSRMTKAESLVSLFSFATACCNRRLWKPEREFSVSLHCWKDSIEVLRGRHPNGGRDGTKIFLTPNP